MELAVKLRDVNPSTSTFSIVLAYTLNIIRAEDASTAKWGPYTPDDVDVGLTSHKEQHMHVLVPNADPSLLYCHVMHLVCMATGVKL